MMTEEFMMDARQNAAPQEPTEAHPPCTGAGSPAGAAPAALQKRLDDAGEGLPREPDQLFNQVGSVKLPANVVWQEDYDALRAAAESIIARKDAEIARLREDAERYRQLRNYSQSYAMSEFFKRRLSLDQIDYELDAAIAARKRRESGAKVARKERG